MTYFMQFISLFVRIGVLIRMTIHKWNAISHDASKNLYIFPHTEITAAANVSVLFNRSFSQT